MNRSYEPCTTPGFSPKRWYVQGVHCTYPEATCQFQVPISAASTASRIGSFVSAISPDAETFSPL